MGSLAKTTDLLDDKDQQQLHMFFFPYLAVGHMIPVLEIARLFAERGVKASYVTTPANVPRVRPAIDDAVRSGLDMQVLVLPFPSVPEDSPDLGGLPAGCENTNSLPNASDDTIAKFYQVAQLLLHPMEQLVRQHRPDCLVADEMYPWTADLAHSLGIPRILFVATSHFNAYVANEIEYHMDYHSAMSSDAEPFVVPGLPHKIQITKGEYLKHPKHLLDVFRDSERKSYGQIMNSFDELAPEYMELWKRRGRRICNLGPVAALASRGGRRQENNDHEKGVIKSWLDVKDDGSVLYVAFGTECIFSNDQLREITLGLEASGHPFIWEVRSGGGGLDTIDEWLPKGFQERVEGRALILRGGAPQLLILNHPAVGGFVTHCGLNSTSEALCAGVPMITWPLNSDQFITERLIVQVLGVGVTALEDVKRSVYSHQKGIVKAEKVKTAVDQVMGRGEAAKEMQRRANKYKELSRSVLEEGGSSYVNLTRMIEELAQIATERRKPKNQC